MQSYVERTFDRIGNTKYVLASRAEALENVKMADRKACRVNVHCVENLVHARHEKRSKKERYYRYRCMVLTEPRKISSLCWLGNFRNI